MEWLNNIGQWFSDNYEGVVAFLSSANMASIIGNIMFIFKQAKTTLENTNIASSLTAALATVSELKEVMSETVKQNEALANELQELKAEHRELDEKLTSANNKLSGIVDALTVVYSTVKDETVRRSVENILTATKYDELPIIGEEIQNKITESVKSIVSKVKTDLAEDFVTKQEFASKTTKQSKTTARY